MVNLGVTGTVRHWTFRINGQNDWPIPEKTMQAALEMAHSVFKDQCDKLDELESAHVKCFLVPLNEKKWSDEVVQFFPDKTIDEEIVWLSYKKGGDCLECGRPFEDNTKWWPCCSRKCAAEHYN